jgi:putative membrane protein
VMRLVRRLAYMWSFNLLALYAAAALISGISYSDSFGTLALTALVFAAVNMFVKPATKLLAFPLILLTLGVALFFINVLMLYVTDWIVPGFRIGHFGAAVWATIVVWGVNWVLQIVFDVGDRSSGRARRSRRQKHAAES